MALPERWREQLKLPLIAGRAARNTTGADDGNGPRGFDHQRLLDQPIPEPQNIWSAGDSVTRVHNIVDAARAIKRTTGEYLEVRQRTHELLAAAAAIPTINAGAR